jgi:hypothetical protein
VGLSFVTPELAKWDALGDAPAKPELLVAPFFADERPLRGAAGLVDWRLCGRLSRLIASGRIQGELGETTLLPAMRLAFQKVVLVGLGPSEAFDEGRFREAVRGIRRLASRMNVTRYALPLPGRSTGRIMARRALELWLEEKSEGEPHGEQGEPDVWLIEPQSAQKDMSDALGRRAR